MADLFSGLKSKLQKRGHVDYAVLFTTIALTAFGLLMLFSASFYYGQNRFGDGYYYVKRQLVGVVIGFVAMFVLANVDYRRWLKLWKPIYAAGLLLMCLVWVPGLGVRRNSANRWFVIPGINLSVQPAELAKYALIIAVAALVVQFGYERMQSFRRGVIPILLLMAPLAGLLLLQPNFSMLVSLAVACFAMLVMSGMRWLQIGVLFGAGLGVGSALMFARGYREERVSGFLDPWNDPSAHQLRQSLIAFGSGGIWGQGLGASRQKFLFLPYGESDMIFSIIAEELGLVGAAILVLTYVFLFTRCYRIAMRCPDAGGSLLAAGCTTLLAIQTVINMGVATGLLPTTGQTLPFISYGSTSIVVCLAVMGLILNVSRSCN